MTIDNIMQGFKNRYICVINCIKDSDNLVTSADVIRVYDTLDIAKDNASEIRKFMKKYDDFDILYGDYEDYVKTRNGKNIKYIASDDNKKCSQREIDFLINKMNGGM